MKIQKLKIQNIGPIEDMEIEPKSPLNIFYGEIKAGKTTILNAVKFCFGGSFPSDIITHGKSEAMIEITFDNAFIRRTFYHNKTGQTVARPIEFVKDGSIVQRPVEEIKKFLNPFLLNQNFLADMTETERKKYFTEFFDIDTQKLDEDYDSLAEEAKELRIKISSVGDINPTPVKQMSIEKLKEERTKLQEQYTNEYEAARIYNNNVEAFNSNIEEKKERVKQLKLELRQLEDWLMANTEQSLRVVPEKPKRLEEIDDEITTASANNVRYEQYLKDKQKLEEKNNLKKELLEKEATQRELKKKKAQMLKEVETNIKDLQFDQDGNVIYEGTTAGMLSTSQLMKLSEQLSKLYPEGFGLSLIDRGESLGKSIFEFIEEAEQRKTTIMATVVGDKPATVPENIGVYVVKDGRLEDEEL